MPESSDQTVHLPARLQETIIAHARQGRPEEICGVLRGRGLAAFEVVRGRNIAAERIENYEVDPQTLLLQFQFEEQGDEMMGIYHSHPVSVAYPSATDAWNAHYPECIYFICSLEHEAAPVVRAFRMTPHFLALDWAALLRGLPVYETRRGLWAYYQPSHKPVPSLLADVAEQAPAPFYLVMFGPDGQDGDLDGRVVSVTEHPIQSI
jgi:proteasome lid subunit RPN8/RPN11